MPVLECLQVLIKNKTRLKHKNDYKDISLGLDNVHPSSSELLKKNFIGKYVITSVGVWQFVCQRTSATPCQVHKGSCWNCSCQPERNDKAMFLTILHTSCGFYGLQTCWLRCACMGNSVMNVMRETKHSGLEAHTRRENPCPVPQARPTAHVWESLRLNGGTYCKLF